MKGRGFALLFALLIARPLVATAQDPAAGLYDQATLEYWTERYAKSTRRILVEGLFPELRPEEYQVLRQVELVFPVGADDLIGFYAVWPPPRVVLPGLSLKLLDDLSVAFAWLWAKGYSLETIEEYVAMLRYKRAEDFPEGRYPQPFPALGIPENALQDQKIDDLSLRFFNSARAFILAHELAHLLYRHQGQGAAVLENEIAADRFAVELLSRTGTIPMGMILYFQAMAQWLPNRAQFASDQAWQAYLDKAKTHPLSGERVAAIARALEELAPGFARNDPKPQAAIEVVRSIAKSLTKLVDYLEDPELQLCVAESAAEAELAALAPRRAGSSILTCDD